MANPLNHFENQRNERKLPPIPVAFQLHSRGRPTAPWRMDAVEDGIVLRSGDGPGRCDYLGAHEAIVYETDSSWPAATNATSQ